MVEICYEILAIFSTICFIAVLAETTVDFIAFIAFYFSLEETIVNALFLSFGNMVGDLFGNMALAKAG